MAFPSTILGYPRVGKNRELKKALESFWAGKTSEADLRAAADDVRFADFERLAALGLAKDDASIPENSSFYDQVLDITYTLGAAPERFRNRVGLDLYFALARGDQALPPQEMTKWFDTNYHYLVPEIGPDTPISFANTELVNRFASAESAGYLTRPVLVGPVTYLALAKAADDNYDPFDRLDDVVAAYTEILAAFAEAGATAVELDEPAVVSDNLGRARAEIIETVGRVYTQFASLEQRPDILLAAPYGDSAPAFATLVGTGVEAVAIDLTRGHLPAETDLTVAAEADVTVLAGVIDGRNIWRADLSVAVKTIEKIREHGVNVAVTTSNSLQHVPHTVAVEKWDDPETDSNLHEWLAFADEKVTEVVTLAKGLDYGWNAINDEVEAAIAALAHRAEATGVKVEAVRSRVAALTEADRRRNDYAVREAKQAARLNLPLLPTTTIGSFPQTVEVRKARAAHNKGEMSDADYETFLQKEIADVIKLQEELGLDVLVHGEAERNDMVQYFAELLDGFEATKHGWVQSYGSRCTRPSILWGDVSRSQDLTVRWWRYAQEQTELPVKDRKSVV